MARSGVFHAHRTPFLYTDRPACRRTEENICVGLQAEADSTSFEALASCSLGGGKLGHHIAAGAEAADRRSEHCLEEEGSRWDCSSWPCSCLRSDCNDARRIGQLLQRRAPEELEGQIS